MEILARDKLPHKRIIVHAGLPRTGTASIEGFLAGHRDELASAGFVYPLLMKAERNLPGHHTDLLHALHSNLRNEHSEGDLAKWQVAIDSFIGNKEQQALIISQESFGLPHYPVDFGRLASMFRGVPVEVVLLVRSAEEWLTSLYEQLVRSSGPFARTPDRFGQVTAYIGVGFEGMLKALETRLPGARVRVVPFDAVKRSQGVVAAFLEAMQGPRMEVAGSRRNERSDPAHVAVLLALKQMSIPGKTFEDVRKWLVQAETGVGAEKGERTRIFANAVTTRIAQRFEADIAYINGKYGVLLPREQPLPEGEGDPMTLTVRKLDAVLATLATLPGFSSSGAVDVIKSLRGSVGS